MDDGNRIRSTETAFEILDYIARTGSASATELSEHLDFSRTGVYKHLRTLESLGAIENNNGSYILGSKFKDYTIRKQVQSSPLLADTTLIDDLSVSLDAPVNLWSAAGRHCVCIYTTIPNEGRENPRRIEESILMVDSAPGKTVLAYHDQDEYLAQMDLHDGPETTDNIREQLQTVRERDLLIESLAPRIDWFSISSPILGASGDPLGTLEVVIPSERARGINVEVNIAGLLLDTANKLEMAVHNQ